MPSKNFTTEEFDAAFAKARKSGAKTFMLGGNKYSTKTAEGELSERRAREKSEDQNAPMLKRVSDAFTGKDSRLTSEQSRNRRQGKKYDDFVVENRNRPMGLSRGAQMRADALIKERKTKNVNPKSVRKVKAYGGGGTVRGSGKATKGTRACKMVTMKGS